jgi:hypothetical protein
MCPFALPLLMMAVGSAATGGPPLATERPRISECRIGFDGYFKVGHWTPIRVVVAGDIAGRDLKIQAATIDSDGVRATTTEPLEKGRSAVQGIWPVTIHARIGRIGAPVELKLLAENGDVLDHRELSAGSRPEVAGRFSPLSASGELLVQLGASPVGLEEALRKSAGAESARSAFVRLHDIDALPTHWFAYEAVDVLVLTTGDVELMRRLADDKRRFHALREWLELGGRLVLICGEDGASELLADGGPLASLVPGKFAALVRLPETAPLEHFAQTDVSIAPASARVALMVPQLTGVQGEVEVYAGLRPNILPLVVRAPHGLGEVAFCAVDLSKSPLREWVGRKPLLQALLRPYRAERGEADAAQSLIARGYNDLSGALRQRLGRSFDGVAPISFSLVLLVAIAYLLTLGPLDYLIVHRWLRRPWVAWVSFPLIVCLFGLVAIALAGWRQPDARARVNRLEIVDVDMLTGRARGTYWATLYSPRAERFNLSLDIAPHDDHVQPEANTLIAAWGLPGIGIGGMDASGAELQIVQQAYRYGPGLDSLAEVPVLGGATKSFLVRWTAHAPKMIEARLADVDGLAAGYIENRSGMPLLNLRLLYNGWAYRLGNLRPGRRIDVGDETSPRRVKTIVMHGALGLAATAEENGNVFVVQHATAAQILNVMMFYEAAGGFAFARLANNYQAYCDLSRFLELGRAIAVVDVPAGGSRLADAASGESLADERDPGSAVYRFVLPVNKQ